MNSGKWENLHHRRVEFYLWSWCLGSTVHDSKCYEYHELMDKLLEIGMPFMVADDMLYLIQQNPVYFEITEGNNLFFRPKEVKEL